MMKTHEFILVLADVRAMSDELAERLYEVGCDDGSPYSRDGVAAIGFSREASTLEEAIRTAVADVQKAGCRVARVHSPEEQLYTRINQELSTA